jgi:hypothetical protein
VLPTLERFSSRWFGMVVAGAVIAAETLGVHPLADREHRVARP